MHSTFDFCPRPARKETNVPLHKRRMKIRAYCPNMHTLWLHIKSTYFTAIVSVFRSAMGQNAIFSARTTRPTWFFFVFNGRRLFVYETELWGFLLKRTLTYGVLLLWLSAGCKPSIIGVKRTVREDLYIQGTFYSISSYSMVYIR